MNTSTFELQGLDITGLMYLHDTDLTWDSALDCWVTASRTPVLEVSQGHTPEYAWYMAAGTKATTLRSFCRAHGVQGSKNKGEFVQRIFRVFNVLTHEYSPTVSKCLVVYGLN